MPDVYIFVMNNSQLYKGSLSLIILKLLEENKRMYGYKITQKVKEQTNGEVVINEGAMCSVISFVCLPSH